MRYRLYINGKLASAQGIILGQGSVAALRQHGGLKEWPSNENAGINGKRVLPGFTPKAAARDVQLTLGLQAASFAQFIERYNKFVNTLEAGAVDLRIDTSTDNGTTWTTGETYHLLYMSCAQYSEFNGRLAKFIAKFNEPNPKNRTA